jgi:hypothetical protein
VKHPAVVEPEALLGELTQAGVEFIVVGGTAAILHAAPVTTQDLDIVYRRTPENVVRLMGVLTKLDAVMRYAPTPEMLLGRGQVNLSTTLGPLDPLCERGEGQVTTSFCLTRSCSATVHSRFAFSTSRH